MYSLQCKNNIVKNRYKSRSIVSFWRIFIINILIPSRYYLLIIYNTFSDSLCEQKYEEELTTYTNQIPPILAKEIDKLERKLILYLLFIYYYS